MLGGEIIIKNNPCWPYSTPKKDTNWCFEPTIDQISELDINGPTVEEYLASLEVEKDVELKAAPDMLTFIDSGSMLEAGPGLNFYDDAGNQTIRLDDTVQVQRGSADHPSYTFNASLNSGMYYTGYGIGFTINGKNLVEIDEYCGLLLQTNKGEVDVARELQESHDKINHLLSENVVLTNTINDLESRLSFLESSRPWGDFI